MDTVISLIEDLDARVDGAPSNLLAVTSGATEVGTLQHTDSRSILLTVDGDGLDAPLAFPLVGHLTMSVAVESATIRSIGDEFTFAMGLPSQVVHFDTGRSPIDVDWLAFCEPGKDCVIPLEIGAKFHAPADSESLPGYVRFAWTLEVTLEAFDGRTLPADVLVLTER